MAQAETVNVRWKDKTQRSPAEKKRMAREARSEADAPRIVNNYMLFSLAL